MTKYKSNPILPGGCINPFDDQKAWVELLDKPQHTASETKSRSTETVEGPLAQELAPDDNYIPGRVGNWIRTYSGGRFWPIDPHADEVNIEDIAHALSLQCRYTGHCRVHWSVAQHSIVVSSMTEKVNRRLALAGLLHDAAEAYLSDIARPVKVLPFMNEMRAYQNKVERVIENKFKLKLSSEDHIVIKYYDNLTLQAESELLMPKPFDLSFSHDMLRETKDYIKELNNYTIPAVEALFLERFNRLCQRVRR